MIKKSILLFILLGGIATPKSKVKVTASEFEQFIKTSIRESISIKVNF